MDDFNVGPENTYIKSFCNNFDLTSLIKEPTCFKNPENPSCIDPIFTNRPRGFQKSCAIETGLSEFHKMALTVMKKSFQKYKPRIIKFRDYRHFQNNAFREDLLSELLNFNIEISDEGFTEFCQTYNKHLNYHAPCKEKYVRDSHLPFMNKILSKEIMKRTRLRNKFLKDQNKENKSRYSKQRNYCVSLIRKMKKDYYSTLDVKKVTDNKNFWKTIRPFLTDKIVSTERITLIDNGEVVVTEKDPANVLNIFFSNIVANLKIPEYVDYDPIANNINISDPILKVI